MNKKTLKDVDVKEKRVLVRVDFNVPLSGGRVADDTRIRAALPTIKHLIDEKARIILMSHLGRPGGEPDEDLRMDPVAQSLANILSEEAEQYHSIVRKVDSCTGDEPRGVVEGMGAGDILLLENTRFYAQEKENDPEVSRELASMADLYVNDAFGTAHRAHASTAGVAEHLPSCAGFLIQNELEEMMEEIHQAADAEMTKRQYNQLIKNYNQTVEEYNELIKNNRALVEEYNSQIDKFNVCVKS